MTLSMIMWTLDLLDWVRAQTAERWPGVKLRGGETDIDPEPYRIRFRGEGKQHWLVLSPNVFRYVGIAEVISLLEDSDWIATIQKTGVVSVDAHGSTQTRPFLVPCSAPGPEVKMPSVV